MARLAEPPPSVHRWVLKQQERVRLFCRPHPLGQADLEVPSLLVIDCAQADDLADR